MPCSGPGQGPVATVLTSMKRALQKRASTGKLRRLPETVLPGAVDFTSNDYLGLARCPELAQRIQNESRRVESLARVHGGPFIGATGSRLLSGTTWYHNEVENWLASFFRRESALVFNSGYDLNLGLLACLSRPGDAILFDELVHNSSVMGLRLGAWRHLHSDSASVSKSKKLHSMVFRHNDVDSLESRLEKARALLGDQALLFVAVEAVYSMDGDVAPLSQICDAAARHGACVIVDEAHSTGVLGPGGRGLVCAEGLEDHPALLCSIHTFGKALGCHGAVLCGPQLLRDYCANYCAPFIYSTASSFHSLASMRLAAEYQEGPEGDRRRSRLHALVHVFRKAMDGALGEREGSGHRLLPSSTAIQALLVPGNERVTAVAAALQAVGLDVRPLRPPTVPAGMERLRVVLHFHNTEEELRILVQRLSDWLNESLMEGGSGGAGSTGGLDASTHSSKIPMTMASSICSNGREDFGEPSAISKNRALHLAISRL